MSSNVELFIMYIESGDIVFSPSDLTLYMGSSFASWMEHLAVLHPEKLPAANSDDALSNLLKNRGLEHESNILNSFKERGLKIAAISKEQAPEETYAAMASGVDVIYQAALELSPFRGFVDFLVRVKGKSLFGDYHYEIWDTKLAKSVKPYFLIQLCCYAEMLEAIQQRKPEFIVVVLGSCEEVRLRTSDYFYYYKNLKQRFLYAHQTFSLQLPPNPADSTTWGRWSDYATSLLIETDHLSQIATITKNQIKKLNKAGIKTVRSLINTTEDFVKGIDAAVFERLKQQAKIQKDSIGQPVPLYKILSHPMGVKTGLALLPPESSFDVYFDIEGFPIEEGGLEYLWGLAYFDSNGVRQYKDFWAHNELQEKEAFKNFIEWVYGRWLQNPTMHIYHYANYEIAACRKLMGRYGICEHEVDQLLRNEVFVDLYKVVKGCLILGEPRYSIKNVEHLYREKRSTEVGSGGDSVAVYESWCQNPDGDTWSTSKILKSIREYNIDDCNSTQELVSWLRLRQKEHDISYLGKTDVVEVQQKEEITARIQLQNKLLQKSTQQFDMGQAENANVTSLLAWSLEFHRREKKPMYWRLFDRLGLNDEELVDDIDCLAHCVRTPKPPYKLSPKDRLYVYEYAFDPNQEFKGSSDKYFVLGKERADGKNLSITFIKEDSRLDEGYIALKTGEELGDIVTLIPDENIRAEPIPAAITKQVESFDRGNLEDTAIFDFLMRKQPRIIGHPLGNSIAPAHDPLIRLTEIIKAVCNLDNSYLAIQGPPGSGKTYTAKHVIAELLRLGKKIGISSNSHKAINHLLISTAEYCQEKGIQAYFACTKNTDEKLDILGVEIYENKNIVNHAKPACVIGTTAWGFARDDLEDIFDYLFIDEAGQVSVANLIAMSQSTKNIVLMGDQMQLGQPSQGSHPGDSGLSILDYLLHTTPTIPDFMGVFLGRTYRMHSAVNQFISEAIYEGKLESAPENDCQSIKVPAGYQGILNKEAGIIAVPIPHEGNTQASDEEVERIVELANQLIGRIFIKKNGTEHPITWSDILFVAPYNHQVNKLRQALGKQARVGSVDKFQGQEAPIVFLRHRQVV